MKTQGWQIAVAIRLGMSGAIGLLPHAAIAQLVADPSLGTTVEPLTAQIDLIKNGARSANGANLFHSFQEFNIGQNRGAYFIVPDTNVLNILARVTGSNPSQILGILGTRQQLADGTFLNTNANLFLMNPNGIIFGQGARLDVGGSFVATTANAIQFGDRGFFSASLSEPPSQLLTIDPSALVFNAQLANPGKITVQGDGQGTRTTTNLIDTQNALRVPENRTLALVGGDLSLEGATLKTAGGRIELGSVAPGSSVKLIPINKGWALDYTGVQNFQDVQLTQQATVDASGAGGGDIQVQGRAITLASSSIEASTLGSQAGGSLNITASDSVNFSGIATDKFYTGLFAQAYTGSTGTGGNINVNTNRLSLAGNYVAASTSTYGSGQGGNLTIHANDLVEVTGSDQSNSLVRLEADAAGDGGGNGGNVTIDTRQLRVKSAQVSASTTGTGQAGNLTIRATDSIELSGEILDNTNGAPGGLFAIVNNGATGQGGNLTINTGRLSISDGSKAQAISFGRGNSGNVNIIANDVEVFETALPNRYTTGIFVGAGLDPNNTELAQGGRGNLTIRANRVSLRGGQISADTQGQGDAGDLTIETEQLRVSGGASISASTYGVGNAGNLIVDASDFIELSGDTGRNGGPGGLLAQVNLGATGHGGNLTVETRRLSVSDGSKVQVSTFGDGDAGNLFIKASEIDVFNTPGVDRFFSTSINADVAKDSRFPGVPKGNGGDLVIETGRLSIGSGAEVTVDTSGQGNAGRLLIKATDLVEVVGRNAFLTADVNSGATGQGGSLTIEAKRLSIRDGGQVGSSTFGTGDAGNVFVRATDIDILGAAANGNPSGLFSTSSQNAIGNGGNLFVDAENLNLSHSGRLSAQSRGAGTGGNITVNARNIRMRSNSAILTISNAGDGGNIILNAQTIVALENSDILAFAPAGRGGNITFNTRAFLSDPLYRPSPSITDRATLNALLTNGRVDVNASGTVSGTVNGVPDISFLQNSLTQLPTSLTDTTQLLANSCIVRSSKQNGRFVITGSGGLPLRPGDAPISPFPTGEVRGVRKEERGRREEGREETYVIQNSASGTQQVPDRPWKIGDPIVEPQGVYRLPNGELILSRECQN